MVTEGRSGGFWTTLPGILTGVAAVLTATTGLVLGLHQAGVIGGNDTPEGSTPTSDSLSMTSPSGGAGAEGPLVGRWRGRAADPSGANPFTVELQVEHPCRIHKPCGSIFVSSEHCTGRITMVAVRSGVFEFSVDRFTAESGPGCKPGAGEFFEPIDSKSVKYTNDYNGASAVLRRVG